MSDAATEGIDPRATPSGTGCADCEGGDGPGWWFHLRRCAQCGHIGCCDSSPSQHATRHANDAGHPVMASFEPGEQWFYDVTTARMVNGPALAPPQAHPAEQSVPGPADRLPKDWQSRLHDE